MKSKSCSSLETDPEPESCSGTYALLNLQPQPQPYGLIQESPIVLTVRNSCCGLPVVQISNTPIKIGGSAHELLKADEKHNGEYSFQIRIQLVSSHRKDNSYQIDQNGSKSRKSKFWLSYANVSRSGNAHLEFEGAFATITGVIADGYDFFAGQSGCIRLTIGSLDVGILLVDKQCGCPKQKTKSKTDNCIAIDAELYFSVVVKEPVEEDEVCSCETPEQCGCNEDVTEEEKPTTSKRTDILVVAVCKK